MGPIERKWASSITRRNALAALGGMLSGAPSLLRAQLDPRDLSTHTRTPGLEEIRDIFDFEPICFANIPLQNYDYMARAGDSEWTKRRNRHVFDWVDLVERPGVSTDAVDTSTELFGVRMAYPIVIAPTSNQAMLHPTADIGAYQAASANGTLFSAAHGPSTPHEEIATAATGPRWTQLYPSQNLNADRERLAMYEDLGAKAIIFTVDQQATFFERAQHNRYLGGEVPADGGGGGAPAQPLTSLSGVARYRVAVGRLWYNWDAMEERRQTVKGPVMVKGILTPEDAEICIARGFDGIIVSNHGARSLDYDPSTLEVLPEIVDAVRGRITVMVDSGFRRGSDIYKAMALGADGVCVGRATRWALGAFGAAGVQRGLEILQAEFRDSMARTGRGDSGGGRSDRDKD